MREGTPVGPYEIISPISSGGMGEVYRARDTRLGREVALKFLPEGKRQDRKAVSQFLWEARAASALNHPNIITIYDVGETADGHFIAMEFVRGKTLGAYRGQSVAFDKVHQIATQMVSAIAAAHAAGVVHRDIKPENVMLREDGYVKILDFGLAWLKASVVPGRSTTVTDVSPESGVIAGTLRYMSPEQAQGEALSASTDIFSLGILWYELAAGRHPFEAESLYGVVHAILGERPIAPSSLNPEIPGWFESLLLRMLYKGATERPAAAEVAAELAATHTAVSSVAAMPVHERRTVGRESERAILRTIFERTAGRRGHVFCVAGEPGIGKSTFVEDFLAELRLSGASFRVGRGKSSETLVGTEAYLPLLEALDGLRASDGIAARTMKALAPSWYAELGSAARDRTRTLSDGGSLGQMKRELAAFLQDLCLDKPLVLFFDDIHWADDTTIDVIAYLAGKIQNTAALFVVAYRPEELALRNHAFLRIRRDLQARGIASEIRLGFLSAGDVSEFISIEFPDNRFPASFPELIHAKTEGNALFMVDVLHFLRDQGIIARENEQWSLVESVPEIGKMLPESVRGMIQRKIDVIDAADIRLLVTAAAQGTTFEAAVVAAALKMEAADVEESLERLDRVHGLVRRLHEKEFPDGTLTLQYQFLHVLYHNVLAATLTPARRASTSAAVARALEGFYGDKTGEVVSALAVLWEAARDFNKAVEYFLAAARDATRVFAHREAVIMGERGLDLLEFVPQSPDRSRRELELLLAVGVPLIVSEGFASSKVHEVYVRASQLCEQLGESSRLIRILRGLWTVQMVRLNINEASLVAEQLQRLGKADGERYQVLTHIVAGLTEFYRGAYASARFELTSALELWNPEDEKHYQALFPYDHAMQCEAGLARILWAEGYPDQGLQFALAAVKRSRDLKNVHSLVYALYFLAVMYHYRGELDPFDSVVKEMAKVSAEHSHAHFAALADFLGGWSVLQRGHTRRGLQRMTEGLNRYRAVEAASSLPHFLSLTGEAYGSHNEPALGLQLVEEAIELAERGGAHFYDAELWRVKGVLTGMSAKTAAGAAEANACLEKALDIARRQGTRSFELRTAMALVEPSQGTANLDTARERLRAIFTSFTEGLNTHDLQRARSLLA